MVHDTPPALITAVSQVVSYIPCDNCNTGQLPVAILGRIKEKQQVMCILYYEFLEIVIT